MKRVLLLVFLLLPLLGYAANEMNFLCEEDCGGGRDPILGSIVIGALIIGSALGLIVGSPRTKAIIVVLIGIPAFLSIVFHPAWIASFFAMLFIGPPIADVLARAFTPTSGKQSQFFKESAARKHASEQTDENKPTSRLPRDDTASLSPQDPNRCIGHQPGEVVFNVAATTANSPRPSITDEFLNAGGQVENPISDEELDLALIQLRRNGWEVDYTGTTWRLGHDGETLVFYTRKDIVQFSESQQEDYVGSISTPWHRDMSNLPPFLQKDTDQLEK